MTPEKRSGPVASSLFEPDDLPAPAARGQNTFLPAAIAVAALLVALAALYFGVTAGAGNDLTTRLDTVSADLQGIQRELDQLERNLATVADSQSRDISNLGTLSRETETRLNEIARAIGANRERLGRHTDSLDKIAAEMGKLAGGPLPAPSSSSASQVETTTTRPASSSSTSGATVHTVKPGDTLGALAKQYGVELNDLLLANPTVDPRRMSVGTKIVIPQKR